jgi:hypothetical protein
MTDQPPLPEDDEAAALFSRLREAAYRRPAVGAREPGPSIARDEAERAWPVSVDRPFLEASGGLSRARGIALRPLKAVLRRSIRWYIEPALADQRRFNAAVLELLDDLRRRIDAKDKAGEDSRSHADPGAGA